MLCPLYFSRGVKQTILRGTQQLRSSAKTSTARMKHYHFESKPVAHQDAAICGPHYRFTILTDRLIRYEWSYDGKFEDRASTFAINREFPVPKFQVIVRPDGLEVINEHFHLSYDKKRFSPSGLLC